MTYIYSGWMNEWQTTEKSLNFCDPQSSAKKSIPRRWCERAVLLAHFPEDNFNDIFSNPKVQDGLPGSWYTWKKKAHVLTRPLTHLFFPSPRSYRAPTVYQGRGPGTWDLEVNKLGVASALCRLLGSRTFLFERKPSNRFTENRLHENF